MDFNYLKLINVEITEIKTTLYEYNLYWRANMNGLLKGLSKTSFTDINEGQIPKKVVLSLINWKLS